MTKSEVLYPKLKYFFSAYFHQDWKTMYDWDGKNASYKEVVKDFKANNPAATVNQAIQELESFLNQNLSEQELHKIVVHELGANFRAAGARLTYQQWLNSVLDILKT
ncbi:hypothetical protein H6F97_24655 [Microcoleus sp. FACHB-1]|jgi:hypothetical protein|nr:hypothetical protein [Microcoleus sp. FACHB-1]